MLIALYFLATKLCELPVVIMAWGQVITIILMPIVIVVVGLMLICSAAGVRISEHLGATVLNGIFSAIGYIARTAVNTIGWVIRRILRMLPRVFTGSQRMFNQMGANEIVSTLLAILVTGLIIV